MHIDDMFENEYIWFSLHKTFRPPTNNLTTQQRREIQQILNSSLDKNQKDAQLIAFLMKKSQEEEQKDDGIMDRLEMNVTHLQGDRIEFSFGGKKNRFSIVNNTLKSAILNEHYPDDSYTLISCFYFLQDSTSEPTDRYKDEFYLHGKKMIVITEIEEFFKRINESITKLGFDPEMEPVKYYDPKTYNGPRDSLTPFDKSIDFAHQNEFRIGMRPKYFGDTNLPPSEPMRVYVPGLRQLSYVKEI